ncbi:MAG: hypothetical protein A2076_07060 [Geobacteraceae bacterium GWC2_53_11]|nr:MAG: hypothetical protein A2076_07060 [Geobacteraceae bacterium GWC2_53_11]
MEFKERLKILRKSLGKSQRDMSVSVESSYGVWQAYEAGNSVPGFKVLESIARMGFNVNWLLTGDGEMKKPVRLSESEAHEALKKRLKDLPRARGMQAHILTLEFNGISEETYKAYVYGDYLPTKDELEGLCKSAGGWTFETGTMSTRDEEAEAEITKRIDELIKSHKASKQVDIELLKEIVTEIEEALFKSAIKLEPAKKAELLALVYDYATESEEKRAGIKEQVQRLLRLVK